MTSRVKCDGKVVASCVISDGKVVVSIVKSSDGRTSGVTCCRESKTSRATCDGEILTSCMACVVGRESESVEETSGCASEEDFEKVGISSVPVEHNSVS